MNSAFPARKKFTQDSSTSPLDRLAERFDSDMRQVNALILRHMESDVPLIPQLARYLIAAGGKRIRPLLTLGAAGLFGAKMERAYSLAAAVEFIHTATLLHDDVVDESDERRGQKAANLVFGNQASVLVGDYLFSKSFQLMVESGSLEVLRILSDAAAIIAQGEVLQLSTTNNIKTKMDAYFKVIEAKTAALFAASCEVGPVLAGADAKHIQAMRDYGLKIGIAFQIVDDTLDYSGQTGQMGKETGDDFCEGKMTAPVILALESASHEEREFWERTLARKDQNDNDFDAALKILNRHGALERSIAMARNYADQAKSCLLALPRNEISEIFEALADYTVTRRF